MGSTDNIRRFKNAVEKNKFTMQEELTFIEILVTKYNLLSKSDYAKKEGISPQGVEARLKAKNDPYIYLAGKLLILN